ncbi:MAG: hypothetical protein COT91_03980 [Candidatus Doudnabacteria bacterium CG10_big_fil_rev_8_21_14_0_10_41_10]|uniref:Uncharacterized protein n=1 Tax=Candidatus Doudnabacteria bacterium CG10_big_fil_rev_8_21_14_0_10_41_10 TaxID=1974551 RepID=A0A2H0VEX5_9BACT|nr:MAG: hypothetical protein COT91_03980 [Candidatus Doudnabacteria bacterium CG10_big_fil_rev_8_21_14_0_10_41_10]
MKKNEWVKPASMSPLSFADYLGDTLGQEAIELGNCLRPVFIRGRPSAVVTKSLRKLFINGFKRPDPLRTIGNFRYRIVEAPDAALRTASTVLALAFELELELEPRYCKDGVKGQYRFRFIIKANRISLKKDYNRPPSLVEIRTSSDHSVNYKVKREVKTYADEVRVASEAVWEDFTRGGLLTTVSGGLPGLGKRR